jgi:hypothetical protein
MEVGKQYEVYYKDDTQTRHKTLVFMSNDNGLVTFDNKINNKIEVIPVHNIIRIQGEKDDNFTRP